MNLKSEHANQYREQVRNLREHLDRYISEHPDMGLAKMILSGSLAKSTALRTINDIDVGLYVAEYEFGFLQDNQRLLTWRYTVDGSGINSTDDRPGRIISGYQVASASWFNRLIFSSSWFALSQAERDRINSGLPFQRVTKDGPKDGLGYWTNDLNYSASGVSLGRRTFRPYTS